MHKVLVDEGKLLFIEREKSVVSLHYRVFENNEDVPSAGWRLFCFHVGVACRSEGHLPCLLLTAATLIAFANYVFAGVALACGGLAVVAHASRSFVHALNLERGCASGARIVLADVEPAQGGGIVDARAVFFAEEARIDGLTHERKWRGLLCARCFGFNVHVVGYGFVVGQCHRARADLLGG